MTYSQILGRVIADHRRRLWLTQAELGGELGLSQAGYSGLERGRSPLTVTRLRQIASVLGVSAGDLLTQADLAGDPLQGAPNR